MSQSIDGELLKSWGFIPGPNFGRLLSNAKEMEAEGHDHSVIFANLQSQIPAEIETMALRTNALPFRSFLEYDDPECESEKNNHNAVIEAMDRAVRIPTITAAAVMPDACPAGTLPVGGVVAAKDAIHPDMHSADICCSITLSVFKRRDDVSKVLDAAMNVTHFGPAPKSHNPKIKPPSDLLAKMEKNPFLKPILSCATTNFMTQGDGNHFLFVGHLESSGHMCVVTHHGSRGLGAQLYKLGMKAAQKHTHIVAPEVDPKAAWLDTTRDEGREYWEALQLVRLWTKANHAAIHDQLSSVIGNRVTERLWNEHNFVFRKTDGLFYHAKGATPSYGGFAEDDSGVTIIPMNMAAPILLTAHTNNREALGFAPHGAGRNMSRTQFLRNNQPEMPEGIDARFYCGHPDLSELPQAYKSHTHISRIIKEQKLADIIDRVVPAGSIMAGEWDKDAPWKKRRKKH